MVILSQEAGASGRYFFTKSSVFNFPRSSRSDIESSRRRIWNAPFQVRHAVALAENDLSVFSHQYTSHEHLVIDIRLHNSLQAVARRLSTGAVPQYCEGRR